MAAAWAAAGPGDCQAAATDNRTDTAAWRSSALQVLRRGEKNPEH